MDVLAQQIRDSVEADPQNFDGRERLWMQREDLRSQLPEEDLTA